MSKEILSENFSFKGWEFWNWWKGNWKSIKEVLKIGIPFVLGLSFFRDNPALIGTVTVVGKFVIDTIEYWIKKY